MPCTFLDVASPPPRAHRLQSIYHSAKVGSAYDCHASIPTANSARSRSSALLEVSFESALGVPPCREHEDAAELDGASQVEHGGEVPVGEVEDDAGEVLAKGANHDRHGRGGAVEQRRVAARNVLRRAAKAGG
eukprot:61815-Pleurochrysis_carterae.AAC.3